MPRSEHIVDLPDGMHSVAASTLERDHFRARDERAEFRALCNRLNVRRWYAANRERKAAYMRAYWQRPEMQERERQRAARRAGV